ncbi:MAG: hypothetical protein QG635_355 [Bacteroidota bacterium]|nr:hypothetical protein [Bacteroidota bacterium]
MPLIIKLSWRNIWRNWRRSAITIAAIVFAAFLTIFMRGIQLGTYDNNIKYVLGIFSGSLQIQRRDYKENPSLRKSIDLSDEIKTILRNNSKITAYTERINTEGLIGYNDNTQGTAIFGIDPVTEQKVTTLAMKIKSGKFFQADSKYEIILGYKLLKNLQAKIGDSIVVLTNAYDGSMGNAKFKIIGASRLGSPDMDQMTAFIPLAAARELLSLDTKISAVAIACADVKDIPFVKNELQEKLKSIKLPKGKSLTALDWGDIMPEFKQSIEFDNASGIIYLGLLIIIVAFGILNTVIMSVTERFREFGIMLAIGIKHSRLILIVFLETVYLTIIGLIIGNIIGYIVNYYIYLHPITFSGELSKMYEEFGFLPQMFASLEPGIFINTSITVIIVAVVVFIYPAFRISRLEALKGIRYT